MNTLDKLISKVYADNTKGIEDQELKKQASELEKLSAEELTAIRDNLETAETEETVKQAEHMYVGGKFMNMGYVERVNEVLSSL